MAYIKRKIKDDAVGQLQTWITASAVTMTLKAGNGANFPTLWGGEKFIWTLVKFDGLGNVLQKEKILIENISGDVLSTITRAYWGGTAYTFDGDDYLYGYVVAPIIQDIQDEVTRLWTDKLDTAWGLRTALTAWRALYSGASWAETTQAFWSAGTIWQSNGPTNAPSWVSPTVNIWALSNAWAVVAGNKLVIEQSGLNYKLEAIATATGAWLVEMLTDAEWNAWTDNTRYPNAVQARCLFKTWSTTRLTSDSTGSQATAHWLSKPPRIVRFQYAETVSIWINSQLCSGIYNADDNSNRTLWFIDVGATADRGINGSNVIYIQDSAGNGRTATCTVDATNINISWTKTGSGKNISVLREATAQ